MKLISRLLRHSYCLVTSLLVCATSTFAITLTTTNDVRVLYGNGNENLNFASDTALSLYNNGGNIQRTWINFDLTPYFSSLAGKTLSAGVLSLVANTGMAGNALNGASIASGNAYWTKTSITWNTQPGLIAISGAINPVGGVADYDLVNWVIPAATLQDWIATQYTNGVCLSSAGGSTLHFRSSRSGGTPTLTFTAVDPFTPASGIWTNTSSGNWADGNNWLDGLQACGAGQSATFGETTGATINLDTNRIISALAFSNATFTVNGANNTLALEKNPTTPSIFVGAGGTATFNNILSSAEGLDKAGAGTLVLANGGNTLFGTTTVQAGTLRLASRYTLDKSSTVTLEPGTVLQCSTDWALGNTYSSGGAGAGYLTVKSGATLRASSGANVIRHGITLSGGTLDATVAGNSSWGNFVLETPMTINGATSSTISADLRLRDSQTITVNATGDASGNDLFISGKLGHINGSYWGYLVKSGAGTLALNNAANDPGSYTVSQGKLLFIDKLAGGGNGGIINNAVVEARITTNTTSYGYAITGSGTLLKTGPGKLFLTFATSTHSGPTVISNGTLSVSFMADAARHFDASRLNATNGAPIALWDDQSVTASHATVPSGNATPVFTSNAISTTGLPAVYFAKNSGPSNSGAFRFARDTGVRSVFSIFKGNSFLLTDFSSYDFHRPTDDIPGSPLWDSGNASASIRNGSTYVNNILTNGTSYNMPTSLNNGFNLVEVLTTAAVATDSFNKDRTYHAGNQYHAEMIIFDSVVSEARRLQIEAYLNKKWFGIAPGSVAGLGNLMSPSTPVSIFNGSTLDLSEVFYQTLASLSSTDGLGSKVLLGSTATLTVGNATSTSFDGVISGPAGNLIKTGSGTLTLAGTNTYAGVTSVTGGTLRVNGALAAAGPVMVFSNATLSGSGLIAGAVSLTLGSTLSPGSGEGAVGTLTIGSLPAVAGGTLKIDAFADGTCDVLAVQGAADLSGTTLSLTDTSSLNRSYQYTILTCSGTPTAFASAALPGGWKIYTLNGLVKLASSGTVISFF